MCTKNVSGRFRAKRNVETFYKREITHLFSECEKKKLDMILHRRWFWPEMIQYYILHPTRSFGLCRLSTASNHLMFMTWRGEETEEEKRKKTNAQQQTPAVRSSQLFLWLSVYGVCVWCADFFCYVCIGFSSCNAESLIYSPIFSNYNKLLGFFSLHCLLFQCVYVKSPCFAHAAECSAVSLNTSTQ